MGYLQSNSELIDQHGLKSWDLQTKIIKNGGGSGLVYLEAQR